NRPNPIGSAASVADRFAHSMNTTRGVRRACGWRRAADPARPSTRRGPPQPPTASRSTRSHPTMTTALRVAKTHPGRPTKAALELVHRETMRRTLHAQRTEILTLQVANRDLQVALRRERERSQTATTRATLLEKSNLVAYSLAAMSRYVEPRSST